ncbi:hypothetical protein GCM10012284_09900 [Mangrovihabitans endophyticus]|uniref:Deferrochelatase/peroxidase EfeB n=2 Tax=Mangrovihabitans endophyticus TaxID=1751298 RepID=A0A8J3BXF0_9ACTN|nr:hypothetical protein GCM10012284_09900 [Mangrovihabitans endophyticus]
MLAAAAGASLGAASCSATPAPPSTPAPPESAPPRDHQPGVVTAPEDFATLLALDVTDGSALRRLAARAGLAQRAATVTIAVGASLFDDRFGLAGVRPRGLTAMPEFPNDVLDPAWCHGDLLVQIGATTADGADAVAHDLAGDGLRQRWRRDGFRAENARTRAGLPAARNLFGFREGAGNPDPRRSDLMDRLVWAGEGEPGWAVGGTYQVVRLIRLATELWDREPVIRQEAVIGRHRDDDTPLAGGPEDGSFGYASDPDGRITPLDAHIRRANPRTPATERNRILRRGYAYRQGEEKGLIFICFQRDVEAGFATVQRRLDGEALQRYVLPFGGGYYFVPPSPAALAALVPR